MKLTDDWLARWIKRRYNDGDHVPQPPYLLTKVFAEALGDYDRELRATIQERESFVLDQDTNSKRTNDS